MLKLLRTFASVSALLIQIARATGANIPTPDADFVATTQAYLADAASWSLEPMPAPPSQPSKR